MQQASARIPEVGDTATVCIGVSRYAARVTEVKLFKTGARKGQPRELVVEFDGDSVRHFLKNNRGSWREKGWGNFGALLLLGSRAEH